MRVDLFGLTMDAPGVTFYLWSPWRCSALEHKMFDALKALPNVTLETAPDEIRLHITENKAWRAAVQNLSRGGRRRRPTGPRTSAAVGGGSWRPTWTRPGTT